MDRPLFQTYFLRHPDEKWELIYAPSRKGLAAIEIETKTRYDTKNKTLSPAFLRHRLGVNHFHITLTQALPAQPGVSLPFCYTDGDWYALLKDWQPSKAKPETVKLFPDSFFALHHVRSNQHAFLMLEWDTGTQDFPRLNQKLNRYVRLHQQRTLRSPLEPHGLIPGFRVLIVLSNATRQEHLLDKLGQAKQRKRGMFWVTTQDQLTPEKILTEPIWHSWQTLNDDQERHSCRRQTRALIE